MKLSEHTKPAFRTALYFFIFGFFWILLSDKIVHNFDYFNQTESQMQTYKGWFFILITTILIYLVVKQQLRLSIFLKNRLVKSEHLYKKITDITHDLIWSTDANGKIIFINGACTAIYGFSPAEMIGKYFEDFVGKEEYEKNQKIFEEKLKEGHHSVEFESKVIHKDGHTIFLRDTVTAIFDAAGNVEMIEGASADISDYKDYEKQIIQSKERLELAMYGGEIGLWEYRFDTKKLIVNENWNEILGTDINGGEIDFEKITGRIHPDDIPELSQIFGNPKKTDRYLEAEFRIKHEGGTYRWITGKGKVAEWDDETPIRIMGAIMDTTEKKDLEIELKKLVKIYSSFISYSSEGIYLFEMNEPMPTNLPVEEQIEKLYHHGYIRTCNDAFAKMYGYEYAAEMEGTDQTTLHGGDDDPKNIELLRRFINSGYRIMNDITKEIDKNGNLLYISNNVSGIIENGKLLRTWGSQKDITEQVLAQKKIEESEKRYRLIFETNPVPLVIFDADTLNFNDVNFATTKLLGYSPDEIQKLKFIDLRPEISTLTPREIRITLQRELNTTTEINLKSKSGRIIPCEVKLDHINYMGSKAILGALIDLSAIKDAEKHVIQSLIEGADNERSRVAKEIHDSLGQNLTAASLNFNSIKGESFLLGEKNAEKLENGIRFLSSAIEESRNIAHNLMPKAIEDFGIVLALRSLFNQIEKTTDIKIDFYENLGNRMRPDIQTELNLYRITQEALNNVIKHAEATEVFIQLMLHPYEIIYTFEDNGNGFDKMIINSGKKGIGLKSIYNRATAMSGHCDIDSVIGTGTTITIVIPL